MLGLMNSGSQSAAERFLADGFLVIPELISARELELARDVARRQQRCAVEGRTRTTKRSEMTALDVRERATAELISTSAIINALEDLGLGDVRWLSGYVISKQPASPRLWWHQDWWAWSDPIAAREVPVQLAAMLYLEDRTVPMNGCLRVIPGSHRNRHPLHEQVPDAHTEELERLPTNDVAFQTQPDERDVPVHAGDVVFCDARLLHATHANVSYQTRTCVTLWYLPQYQHLPDRFRAHYRQHPCQLPSADFSLVDASCRRLLVDFEGDLHLPVAFSRRPEFIPILH